MSILFMSDMSERLLPSTSWLLRFSWIIDLLKYRFTIFIRWGYILYWQGLTVVNISATTFPQTLDWLHNHLLQVICQCYSFPGAYFVDCHWVTADFIWESQRSELSDVLHSWNRGYDIIQVKIITYFFFCFSVYRAWYSTCF